MVAMASVILCFSDVLYLCSMHDIFNITPRGYKASLQFQKLIAKATDEISSSDLFYVLSDYQGFCHIAF